MNAQGAHLASRLPGLRLIYVLALLMAPALFTQCGGGASSPAPPLSAPIANAGGPYTGTVGQTIHFDGSRSVGPPSQSLSYAWNFGDSGMATGVSPTHSYTAPGIYTVSLAVTGNGTVTDTAITTATLTAMPVLTANPGGPYSGAVNQAISFDGSNSIAPTGQSLSYEWSFGDAERGMGVNPTHTYTTAETYTVSLTIIGSGGGTNTATTTASISVTSPTSVRPAAAGP